MNVESEIKTIKALKAEGRYIEKDFFHDFRPQYKAEIIKQFPDAEFSTLAKYQKPKTVPCKCTKCKATYQSEQTAEEMGMCQACHMRLSDECLAMSPPQDCDKINSRKKATKIFPHHIGKQNIFAIRKFFCENMNVKFSKKNQSPEVIREHFSCASKLKDAEILAMLDINALRKAGLIYEFRKYSN